MKNVLYVGTFLQNDYWGYFSREVFNALLSNKDINLAARPIYYIDNYIQPNDKHLKAINNIFDNKPDITIQTVLPASFSKLSKYNIFVAPNDVINQSTYKQVSLLSDGSILYHPIDTEALNLKLDNIKPLELPKIYDHYRIFYTFASFTNKLDSLEEIVKAYSLGCDKYHDLLIIVSNISQDDGMKKINQFREETGRYATMDKYPEVCIISTANEETRLATHLRGNIYIDLNKINSNNIELYIAQSLNKNLITNNDISYYLDFVNANEKPFVDSYNETIGFKYSVKSIVDLIKSNCYNIEYKKLDLSYENFVNKVMSLCNQ